MSTSDELIKEQIEVYKAQLAQVAAAITVVLTGGTSYSIDSGQTRQSVTRATLTELRKMQSGLLDEITSLEARLCRTGTYYGQPGF